MNKVVDRMSFDMDKKSKINIKFEPLVSIVTPAYNCENYIEDTIKSVLAQSYQNWEMLIVDDLSTDNTAQIIKNYVNSDSRVKYLKLKEKGGASIARNTAINNAKGEYIAFLDGDDMWLPEKLRKQICFMQTNKFVFSYTHYYETNSKFIYGKCNPTKLKTIKSPPKMQYKNLLKGNRMGCLTVIYNVKEVGKINIPRIDKRNDYALWLKILRNGHTAYLCDAPLAIYRNHMGISSGNKFKFIKYHYVVFRSVLEYGRVSSAIYAYKNIYYYFYYKLCK